MSYGNYWGNMLLDSIRKTILGTNRNLYLALHTSDPGPAGSTATELSGGGYARKKVLFSPAGSKSISLSTPVAFTSLRACTVTHYALWDALSGGNIIAYAALTTSKTVANGGQITVTNSQFTVTI